MPLNLNITKCLKNTNLYSRITRNNPADTTLSQISHQHVGTKLYKRHIPAGKWGLFSKIDNKTLLSDAIIIRAFSDNLLAY